MKEKTRRARRTPSTAAERRLPTAPVAEDREELFARLTHQMMRLKRQQRRRRARRRGAIVMLVFLAAVSGWHYYRPPAASSWYSWPHLVEQLRTYAGQTNPRTSPQPDLGEVVGTP